MNFKAFSLGLHNTRLVTPHGLDSPDHYTTAYELALITDYALRNEKFRNIVGTKSYTITINGNSKNISNTNELLGYLPGVYGVKTGFTNGANRCLVTATKRNNLDIICVVLGADTKKDRTKDSIKLIEYAFKNFEIHDTSTEINSALNTWISNNKSNFNIEKGNYNSINLKYDEYNLKEYVFNKNNTENIHVNINSQFDYVAPLKEHTVVGKYQIMFENKVLESGSIYIENEITRKDEKFYIKNFLKQWINCS